MLLNYTSWWFEHNQQHYLELLYNTGNGSLIVKIEDLDPISIESPIHNNRKLEEWDFFIGSKIDVLGKPTILKTCDSNTSIWNESLAHKLLTTRTRLMEEIRKYDSKPFAQKLLMPYQATVPGGFNLRGLVGQVQELRSILMKYRPTLACQIVESELPELNF